MNIAFPAVVLLILLLPGILFRFYYRRGIDASPLTIRESWEEVAYSLLIACIIHIIAIPIGTFLTGSPPPLRNILILLVGANSIPPAETLTILGSFERHALSMVVYFFFVCTIGGLLGGCLHLVVEKRHWDLRYKFFQFPNKWKFLFSGKAFIHDLIINQRREGQKVSRADVSEWLNKVSYAYVSAIVEVGDMAYLYNGILVGYEFDNEGELDRIVILGASRLPLPKKWSDDVKDLLHNPPDASNEAFLYFPIAGEGFVIQYQHVKTLNVKFYKVKKAAPDQTVLAGQN